jgi:hypothetical protein
LATTNDEVDLTVGLLEHTIGVAPFGRRRWSPFLPIVVAGTEVILATSIITSVVSPVVVMSIMAIITTITSVVVTPVVAVIATVVVAPVIAAVVAAVITSIHIVIARIRHVFTVISLIRSTVVTVEALATVPVVIVVASSLLGGRRDSNDAF